MREGDLFREPPPPHWVVVTDRVRFGSCMGVLATSCGSEAKAIEEQQLIEYERGRPCRIVHPPSITGRKSS